MAKIKCQSCEGVGNTALFSSSTVCAKCEGTGFADASEAIVFDSSYTKRIPHTYVNYSERVVRKIEHNNIPTDWYISTIIQSCLDRDAVVSLFNFTDFENSIATFYGLKYNDIKIHLANVSNPYAVENFYKHLQHYTNEDQSFLLEVGGYYPSQITENLHNDTYNGICLACNGRCTIDGFDTSTSCTDCDRTGRFLSHKSAQDQFNKFYEQYSQAGPRKNYDNDERTISFIDGNIFSGYRFSKIIAPPFEFDSDLCLRNIANKFLCEKTRINFIFKGVSAPTEGLATGAIQLNVYTYEIVKAMHLYLYLKQNYFFNNLSLCIKHPLRKDY